MSNGSHRHRRHHRLNDALVPGRRLPSVRPLPVGPTGLHPVVEAAQAALLDQQVADFLTFRRNGERCFVDSSLWRASKIHF